MLKNGIVDYIGTIPDTLDHYLKNDDGNQEEKIINNIKWKKDCLTIDIIKINGTEEASSTITSQQKFLDVHIAGRTTEDLIYDIMLIFRNKDGMPLATFADGHYYGDIQHMKQGAFSIDRHIQLPEILNKGILKVDLFFHHPMVEFQLKAPSCCTLDCEGFQTEFGKSCDQDVNGFIGLRKG